MSPVSNLCDILFKHNLLHIFPGMFGQQGEGETVDRLPKIGCDTTKFIYPLPKQLSFQIGSRMPDNCDIRIFSGGKL